MSLPTCHHEAAVVRVVSRGAWPDRAPAELRAHVTSCAVCRDTVAIASLLRAADAADAGDDAPLPTAGQMWWRLAVRARLDRERAAARPVVWLQGVAAACGLGLVATAFGAKVEKLAALGPATMEAFKDSSKLLAKGAEDVNAVLMGFSKARMEQAALHAKALLAARTIQDFVELQSNYVRGAYEATLAEATKLQSISVQLATDAAKPLQARVTSNVETLLKAA